MSGEKLLEVMKKAARQVNPQENQSDILYGQVMSLLPLKVKVDNRFELSENSLTLSPFCYDRVLTFNEDEPHDHIVETSNGRYTSSRYPGKQISITLWQGLRVGDIVRLLRYEKGQKFYILEKGEIR